VDILYGLCKLIEDSPYFLLGNLFALSLTLGNEFLKSTTLTVLHDDIDSDIFLVDFIIEVPEDVNVLHAYESVDFIDDMFFLLGRKRGKGDLLQHDSFVVVLAPCLEELLPLLLYDIVSLLHL
jgi:hypothetical protein